MAVVNLTHFLAREWAPAVRVNCLTPGFFPNERTLPAFWTPSGELSERGRQLAARTPLGRLGDPDELIGAAVFLADHGASSFVTSADLRVDGGYLVGG